MTKILNLSLVFKVNNMLDKINICLNSIKYRLKLLIYIIIYLYIYSYHNSFPSFKNSF